ncbi:MAG: diguanylate cyclase, partial [Nitriliruptor sp.]
MADGTRNETSGATTGLVLRYVEARAGLEAAEQVIARANLPYTFAELTEDTRWFGYDERIRLFEATVEVLDDPDAPFEVGASSVQSGLNPSLVLLLRALGSPRQVFRQLPRAVPKFTTTSTMQVVEAGATHATIRYSLHEGYTHSQLDCAYAQGLFAAVPTVFGLARARVVHEECESNGYPACLYHVTWDRRSRSPFGGRRGDERTELVALRGQLSALQSAASDLVSSDDLTVALRRIVERAGSAVVAPAYLCVVGAPDERGSLVHSVGLDDERAAELAERLRAGDDIGPNAVVVDVATVRRHHGRLAALYPEGERGLAPERDMLRAYAGHAGAALDQLFALEASRRGESRAQALLDLAHALAVAEGDLEVADTVATALPKIVGSHRASVLRWDPSSGELRAVATAGLSQEQHTALLGGVVRPHETPELVEMLARREPTIIDEADATPVLRQLLRAVGVQRLVAVPLLAADTLLGVATVGWSAQAQTPIPVLDDDVIQRLRGVAEQAAAALQNARLLDAVRHQSVHDALTGLPNRVLFGRRLDATLREAKPDVAVAVLFCDLDRFKGVNDSLGHAAGDELLRQVAGRLRGALRADDLVARLSGDEFAVVASVSGPAAASALAGSVVSCFEEPFRLEGVDLRATTSVGIAVHRGPDGDGETLLRSADAAMYVAKQRGRNQVVAADDATEVDVRDSLGEELRMAIAGGQLRVRYQPIVAITDPEGVTGSELAARAGLRAVGAEALVRWEHPRLGLLSPAAFLPLAEEQG